MQVSNNKTSRGKVTQLDPLYFLSTKKRENTDESNMFKGHIIKEMY